MIVDVLVQILDSSQEITKSQVLEKTFQQCGDKLEAQNFSNVNPDLVTPLPECHSIIGCEDGGQPTP